MKFFSSISKLWCLWRGHTKASFSSSETVPLLKLLFVMLHMMGAKTSMCIFNRDVGIGSNSHDFACAEAIISFISLWWTGVNFVNLQCVWKFVSIYMLSKCVAFSWSFSVMLSILVWKNSLKFSANTETDSVCGRADSCFLKSIPFAMLK